jgi:hypothetical protein
MRLPPAPKQVIDCARIALYALMISENPKQPQQPLIANANELITVYQKTIKGSPLPVAKESVSMTFMDTLALVHLVRVTMANTVIVKMVQHTH